MGKKKCSEEEIDEICKLYESGEYRSTKLGKMYGIDPSSVRSWLKERGIKSKTRVIDLKPGDKFGRWTVLKEAPKRGREKYYLCECSCPLKTKKEVSFKSLRSGVSNSCGCLIGETVYQTRKSIAENVIGNVYGMLTVIKEVENSNYRDRRVLAKCSCDGNIGEYTLSSLKAGSPSSCGCHVIKEREEYINGLIGQQFGRVKILSIAEPGKRGALRVVGECSCPDKIIKEYDFSRLKNGRVNSCGCYHREQLMESITNQVKDYQVKHPLFCKVEEIRDNPNGLGIEVKCKNSNCNKWFKPKLKQLDSRISAIEKPASLGTECNLYCSDDCKHSCILYKLQSDPYEIKERNLNQPTSYELSIWREENLRLQREGYGYNFCTINENHSSDDLIAHHIDPKKLEPGLALDPENCIIVCRECHDELHKGGCSTGVLARIKCNIKGKDK